MKTAAPDEPDPRGPHASRSDILSRLQAISDTEHEQLLDCAAFTAMKFDGKVNDNEAEDILHEAILRALDDARRKWYPQHEEFLPFLMGCIRSIGHSWRKRGRNTESADLLPSPINQQAQTEASITINRVRDCLRGHPHTVEIFDLMMKEGYTGRETQKRLGITPELYATAYKWLFRALKREGFRK